jgi:hypothetical protein
MKIIFGTFLKQNNIIFALKKAKQQNVSRETLKRTK